MSDPDIISAENQFLLSRVPNGETPISNQFCKTVHSPSLERGRDDRYIGSIVRRMTPELGHQFVSIVKPAIPCDHLSTNRDVGLSFGARFHCRVERAIQHSQWSIKIRGLAIGCILSDGLADPGQELSVDRLSLEIPNTCLYTHALGSPLAAFPNTVNLLNVPGLVDGPATDFGPSMSFERYFLCAQHHLGGHTASSQ